MNNNSLWLQDINIKAFEKLSKNIETDVVIVGAGLCGLLTAYLLKDTGLKIVVIDANKVANGTSANNTAKITAQHGLIYKELFDRDEDVARLYKKACLDALENYKKIIEENKIECDYRECDAFVYSRNEEYEKKIIDEYNVVKELGFDAYITAKTELDFQVFNALAFRHQATFHPVKFMNEIVRLLLISGVIFYENTVAVDLTEDAVITKDGFEIIANKIVVASHYPFLKVKGLFPIKMRQERSHVIALSGTNKILEGMYIDANDMGYSFKQHGDLLIIAGQDHKTGDDEYENRYDELEEFSKKLWPESSIVYRWSAQDCMTLDNLPYIGTYGTLPNCYVATGFKKWGICFSMVAANIINDMIIGRVNAESEIFSPNRFKLSSAKKFFEFATDSSMTFIKGHTNPLGITNDFSLKKGEGVVIRHNGTKLGIYRDLDDKLTCISAVCSHLGCVVEFNSTEKTWDCPCHGSRFDINGKVIEGPAYDNLKKYF